MVRRTAALVVLWALDGCVLLAQTVHLVGPGAFPQIMDAVLAAAPGDIIHVMPGTYAVFSVAKQLTIRALSPGTVTVVGLPSHFAPPAGQSVHLVGMRFRGAVVSGSATFDQCTLDLMATSLHVYQGRVQLQDCVLTPPAMGGLVIASPTMVIDSSDVTVIDSRIEGTDAFGFAPPSIAIQLINSTLRGSGLLVRGGNGTPTVPAVSADATSRLWISDSTVQGDPASCPLSVSLGRHDRTTVTPNCSGIPMGLVLGARRLAPPQNGAPLAVEFRASPNAAIGVVAALQLQQTQWPTLEQSLLLPVSTAYPLMTLIADATGFAAAAWPIPAGAGVVDREVWLQAFSGLAWPLQASAVLGGIVR